LRNQVIDLFPSKIVDPDAGISLSPRPDPNQPGRVLTAIPQTLQITIIYNHLQKYHRILR